MRVFSSKVTEIPFYINTRVTSIQCAIRLKVWENINVLLCYVTLVMIAASLTYKQ